MEYVTKKYDYLFHELSDPRLKGWPLMDSPFPVLAILAVYLYTIKIGLPRYMKNRPPYDLKMLIRWYNVIQIIANAVFFHGILTSGWLTTLTFGCHLPSHDDVDPESMSMLKWMYLGMVFRAVDMIETIIFILRKKETQVSFLHVYHHCYSLTMMWIGVKYVGGGMASMVWLLNNPVHVIMYTYYLISAEAGPKLKTSMNKVKKFVTVIQMIQFTILLVHSSQVLYTSCPVPTGLTAVYILNTVIFFYLFYDFFKKTYNEKKDREGNMTVHKNGINGHDKKKIRSNIMNGIHKIQEKDLKHKL